MKTTIFILCFLCTTAAFGQVALSVVTTQAMPLQMVDHPLRASSHAMATEQNLLESSAYTYEKGELPIWEFAPVTKRVPLGDIARLFKEEHATAKKALKVLND